MPQMIVLIDNYDSFTYNLVQRIGELDTAVEIRVYRNDQVTPAQIEADRPSHIIISPGPCTPREAGVSNDSSATSPGACRCWACAWGTSASGSSAAPTSSAPGG